MSDNYPLRTLANCCIRCHLMSNFVPKKVLTRRFWLPITRSLLLMATGAYLLSMYLTARNPQPESLEPVLDGVRIAWFVFLFAWASTTPRQKQTVNDPGPAFSGTAVVLACGFGAAIFLAQGASRPQGFILPGTIVVATVAIAFIVYRFASKHAEDIGEARFQTVASSDERSL